MNKVLRNLCVAGSVAVGILAAPAAVATAASSPTHTVKITGTHQVIDEDFLCHNIAKSGTRLHVVSQSHPDKFTTILTFYCD